MPARPPRTRRPRLLPGALLASTLVVAAAGGVLVATGGSGPPAVDACGAGSEYVTVRPVLDAGEWKPPVQAGPTLSGCVDSSRLEQAGEPTPTNPLG